MIAGVRWGVRRERSHAYLIFNLLSDRELLEREGIFLLRHTGNDEDYDIGWQLNAAGLPIGLIGLIDSFTDANLEHD